MATQAQRKDKIQAILATNPRAVERAVVLLYARQTSDEQNSLTTTHLNGKGFTAFDAEFLSSLARWVQGGKHLSPKQLSVAKKRVPSYWKQLAEEADTKSPGWDDAPVSTGYTVTKINDGQYMVKGGTREYKVTLTPTWKGARCSCPAAVFSKTHSGVCKHELLVRAQFGISKDDEGMHQIVAVAEAKQEKAACLSDPMMDMTAEDAKALVGPDGFVKHTSLGTPYISQAKQMSLEDLGFNL